MIVCLLPLIESPSWATEERLIILAGADCLMVSNKSKVQRKWPRWLTPSCISNPSSVCHLGHTITPDWFEVRVELIRFKIVYPSHHTCVVNENVNFGLSVDQFFSGVSYRAEWRQIEFQCSYFVFRFGRNFFGGFFSFLNVSTSHDDFGTYTNITIFASLMILQIQWFIHWLINNINVTQHYYDLTTTENIVSFLLVTM